MAMKHRYVFKTSDVEHAGKAVQVAIERGIPNDDVHLVARSDIEMRQVSNRRKMADSDLVPAAIRGVLLGIVVGALLSVVIMLIFGAALYIFLLCAGIGAAAGGLGSSLVGASIPDPVRRHFEDEINAGSVLVVIDADQDRFSSIQEAMDSTGATLLPYDAPSALS